MNILVKRFLILAGSFKPLVKWIWSRLVKMEKLGIVEFLVCFSVTLTKMAIVMVCTTKKPKQVTEMTDAIWLT